MKDKTSISPIIRRYSIKKREYKKSSGVWKIAYADFVTAMMSFFLLLWLISVADKATLQGIADYFSQTDSKNELAGIGFNGGVGKSIDPKVSAIQDTSSSVIFGSPSKGVKVTAAEKSSSLTDVEKEHFISVMNSIQDNPDLKNFADNISLDLTNDGLRIQIMDSQNRPMFKPDTAELQPYMEKILNILAKMLRSQPNYLSISGHTASRDYSQYSADDMWRISALRANEVRKFLSDKLIDPDQILNIVGKADREPMDYSDPAATKNIRVGITLLNSTSISAYQRAIPK